MKYSCKKCGKDFTANINQVMINEIILSGRKYINSDGVVEIYKEVSTSCDKTNCESSQYKYEQV